MHEAQMHEESSFITLTYDDKNVKVGLEYEDFRLLMRKIRKERTVRYFVAGEYGSLNQRPHWHALIFGYAFDWKAEANRGGIDLTGGLTDFGDGIQRSKVLEQFWDKGFSSVGTITYESAMYVAKYACKRVYGSNASEYYRRVDLGTGEVVAVAPEFARMSRRPGLGETWFNKYWRDVYECRDGIVQRGGRLGKPPRYYDNLLAKTDPDLRDYKDLERYEKSGDFMADCTPTRLREREICAEAQIARKRTQL